MSDRNLREPGRAHVQQVQALNAKTRNLSQRAYSGAMRSVRTPVVDTGSTSPTALISTEVSAGRWAVDTLTYASATLVAGHVFSTDLALISNETGADLSSLLGPGLSIGISVPVTGFVSLPIPMMGDFSVDEAVTVTLRAWGSTTLATSWIYPGLRLLPF